MEGRVREDAGEDVYPTGELVFEVPFHDVDMLRIVWHGHYYKYFELARTALFRNCSFDIPRIRQSGYYLLVIDSRCRYIAPLRYGMRVWAQARITECEYRLKIDYLLREEATRQKLAKGCTIHAAVLAESNDLCLEIPAVIREAFQGEKSKG